MTTPAQAKKVAIISGGSKGIGLGFVEGLLRENWRVFTYSRTLTADLKALQSGSLGGENLLWESVDAGDFDAVRSFARKAIRQAGRVDALVNNVGLAVDGVLALANAEDMAKQLNVNLVSTIHLTKECIKPMLVARRGSIVNISSIVGSRGYSGLAVYSATKAAMDGFTRSLARELGSRGIRVNSLAPGYTETELSAGLTPEQREQIVRRTPLGRLGTVGDLMGALRFLVSDDSLFFTGQTMIVDGGITC